MRLFRFALPREILRTADTVETGLPGERRVSDPPTLGNAVSQPQGCGKPSRTRTAGAAEAGETRRRSPAAPKTMEASCGLPITGPARVAVDARHVGLAAKARIDSKPLPHAKAARGRRFGARAIGRIERRWPSFLASIPCKMAGVGCGQEHQSATNVVGWGREGSAASSLDPRAEMP